MQNIGDVHPPVVRNGALLHGWKCFSKFEAALLLNGQKCLKVHHIQQKNHQSFLFQYLHNCTTIKLIISKHYFFRIMFSL